MSADYTFHFNRLCSAAATLTALQAACPGDGVLADALETVHFAILSAVEEFEDCLDQEAKAGAS